MKVKRSISDFPGTDSNRVEALNKLLSRSNFPVERTNIIMNHVEEFSEITDKCIYVYLYDSCRSRDLSSFIPDRPFLLHWAFNNSPSKSQMDVNLFHLPCNILATAPKTGEFSFGTIGMINGKRVLITSDFSHDDNAYGIEALNKVRDLIIDRKWEVNKKTDIKAPSPKIDISLGCDPEFELLKDNEIKGAHTFFSMDGPIGTDAAANQLELRPSPSSKPEELIKNIKSLMLEVKKKGFELEAKGDLYPLGFHIHLGSSTKITPEFNFIKALDNWLFYPLKHLNGSARQSYGTPSNCEKKPWGFEYRSLPTGILASKELSNIVLKIAKRLADRWFNGKQIESEPKFEDYIELLNRRDAKFFFDFVHYSKRLRMDSLSPVLSSSWGLPKNTINKFTISVDNISAFSCFRFPGRFINGRFVQPKSISVQSNIPYSVFLLHNNRSSDKYSLNIFKPLFQDIETELVSFLNNIGLQKLAKKFPNHLADIILELPIPDFKIPSIIKDIVLILAKHAHKKRLEEYFT